MLLLFFVVNHTLLKINPLSRCMKILKDEFMDELRTKYGAQLVDHVVNMD